MRRRDKMDRVFDFLFNLLAGSFFLLIAGFMSWLIYAQGQAHKPKAPTCAEAVRVCVASQGAECEHVNQFCETRTPLMTRKQVEELAR